jgi:hypothetical protein
MSFDSMNTKYHGKEAVHLISVAAGFRNSEVSFTTPQTMFFHVGEDSIK